MCQLEPVQEQLRRVGQARFERRPTNLGFIDVVVHQLVGRRGEAPLVPPYKHGIFFGQILRR